MSMGNSRFSASDWAGYSSATQHKSQQQIFTSSSINNDLDPKGIKVRESVDSDNNPRSTPLIVVVDETGSMGILATEIIKNGLGVIMKEVYDRKPIHDPHIMCMAVGDAKSDRSPLQVTQFEASIVLAEQVEKFFIEANGGGNGGESYHLAWYFAAMKTKTDSMIKRAKKGYLFTIGDEPPHMTLTSNEIHRVFGDTAERDYTSRELLDMVSQSYEVFHLIVNPGSYPDAKWKELLGERAIPVTDHTKLAEVIVSTLEVIEGRDVADVVASWSGDTSLVVANAVNALTKGGVGAGTGVTRF
jgi:hypothetical protein